MSATAGFVAGEGPLTHARVLREAWGMFRRHRWRVALVALVIFVPPQVLAIALGAVRQSLETDPGLGRLLGYVVGLLVVTLFRLLGPVVYAGYLDEAVGQEYFRGRHYVLGDVLRTLPWGRLLAADLIVAIGTIVGLALLVVPGIAWLTMFTLVGPVIVREGHGVGAALRRTLTLSRGAWRMILLLVVGLLVLEHLVHEGVHQAVHHESVWLQIAASWAVSALVGGVVGLVEVALATELMARHPLEGRGDGTAERATDAAPQVRAPRGSPPAGG